MNRLEVIQRLPGEQGPLVLLDWWRRGLIALDDPRIREIMLLLARQTGKSQFAAACAASELMCRPGSFTLLVSASEGQQRMIFERKLRRPLERLLRAWSARGIQKPPILFTASGAEVPSTGSVLEVIAPHMQTAPARSPTLMAIAEGSSAIQVHLKEHRPWPQRRKIASRNQPTKTRRHSPTPSKP